MEKPIWISYDLGIKGDYQGLYSWLDDHNAIECGNNVAFVQYSINKDLIPELKKDLESKIDFKPGDRIYLVRMGTKEGKELIIGNFIIGKRKSNPWEGYGTKITSTVDGDA